VAAAPEVVYPEPRQPRNNARDELEHRVFQLAGECHATGVFTTSLQSTLAELADLESRERGFPSRQAEVRDCLDRDLDWEAPPTPENPTIRMAVLYPAEKGEPSCG
jgi:hypothetical protein